MNSEYWFNRRKEKGEIHKTRKITSNSSNKNSLPKLKQTLIAIIRGIWIPSGVLCTTADARLLWFVEFVTGKSGSGPKLSRFWFEAMLEIGVGDFSLGPRVIGVIELCTKLFSVEFNSSKLVSVFGWDSSWALKFRVIGEGAWYLKTNLKKQFKKIK